MRTCLTCGNPETPHNYRHRFIAREGSGLDLPKAVGIHDIMRELERQGWADIVVKMGHEYFGGEETGDPWFVEVDVRSSGDREHQSFKVHSITLVQAYKKGLAWAKAQRWDP